MQFPARISRLLGFRSARAAGVVVHAVGGERLRFQLRHLCLNCAPGLTRRLQFILISCLVRQGRRRRGRWSSRPPRAGALAMLDPSVRSGCERGVQARDALSTCRAPNGKKPTFTLNVERMSITFVIMQTSLFWALDYMGTIRGRKYTTGISVFYFFICRNNIVPSVIWIEIRIIRCI